MTQKDAKQQKAGAKWLTEDAKHPRLDWEQIMWPQHQKINTSGFYVNTPLFHRTSTRVFIFISTGLFPGSHENITDFRHYVVCRMFKLATG